MGAELFLVDNVRFAAGKQQTQKEFFHILNTLYSTGCQIVLASDRSPKDMTLLDERLRMWLEGGTIAGIAKPDYEARLTIVQKLVSERGVLLKEATAKQSRISLQKTSDSWKALWQNWARSRH